MKRFTIAAFMMFLANSIFAQNVQLHYDFGDTRKCLTSTVEMFRPDKSGSTFFFIDMNYNEGDINGVSLAYWEVARAFKLKKDSNLAARVEFNGGMGRWKSGNMSGEFDINNAWLTGLEYTWKWDNFNKIITLQGMFKTIRGKNDASFQLTAVWLTNWLDNKLSFNGFMDFWREDNLFENTETKYVWLTEPQLWYNFTSNISVGTELELSYNFSGNKGFMCNPTLGMKYTF